MIRTLALLPLLAMASCSSGPAGTEPSDGLVLHLPLDGDGTDLAGRSVVQVDGPTAVADRNGRPGQALSFDGRDDLLLVSSNDRLDIDIRSADYTVSLWVRSAGTGRARVFHKWDEDLRTPYPYALQAVEDGALATVYDGQARHQVSARDLWDNAWHHVAVRFQADPGRLSIYVDGTRVGFETFDVQASTRNRSTDSVGGPDPGGLPVDRFFAGRLDELRMYRRALSESEIRVLASS